MWKNRSTSILFVFLWITLCTWTQRWLVFGLPCPYLVKLTSNWLNTNMLHRRREASEPKAKQMDQDLHVSRGIQPSWPIPSKDTLNYLQQIQTWRFSHCQWRNLSSYANQQVAQTLLIIYISLLWGSAELYSRITWDFCAGRNSVSGLYFPMAPNDPICAEEQFSFVSLHENICWLQYCVLCVLIYLHYKKETFLCQDSAKSCSSSAINGATIHAFHVVFILSETKRKLSLWSCINIWVIRTFVLLGKNSHRCTVKLGNIG